MFLTRATRRCRPPAWEEQRLFPFAADSARRIALETFVEKPAAGGSGENVPGAVDGLARAGPDPNDTGPQIAQIGRAVFEGAGQRSWLRRWAYKAPFP
jgi:hypothetical protein